MQDRSKLLADESIGKLLFKLSAPATVGMLVQALYNLVDTAFVGQALGENSIPAIGGIAVAFPVMMIVMATALAIGIGGASMISRSLGKKDQDRAENVMGNVLSMVLIISVLICVLGSIFITPILRLFGATDTILPYATDYLSIILYGSVFFMFALAMNNVVRSEGNAKVAMYTMLISALVNIILDPFFIFNSGYIEFNFLADKLGIVIQPLYVYGFGLGVKGAAIATVLAQTTGAIFLVWYFASGNSSLRFHTRYLIPKWDIAKESISIGMGPLARNASSSLVVIVLNNILIAYGGGDIAIAIFGVANRLFMFTFMPMYGIVQGLQPIVGFNYGARKFSRVMESVKLSMFVTTTMAIIGFIVLIAFPEQLFRIFTTDQQLISSGKYATRIMVLALPLVGFQVVGASLYQAIGKARPSFLLAMSRQLLFLIPLVLILPHFFQLTGVWMAFPLSDSLSFMLTLVMVIREFKVLSGMGETIA
ncbi:MATE family efflux transporter [Methanolobus profundi]|uniref:Multidrug export protein MepA n=1 Tax=Methanolobus profundi TaxID=487685 RepID=A0A1I4SVN7_9EURY|nr:MATE family efflux transporter [Methanolobus profundi]SFM68512.1 putative efflux protein, MATE family [Methanolobus profundi]